MVQLMRCSTGQEVIDLYAFGAKLGQGNYGSVRSCMDLFQSGPPMACKTISYSTLRSLSELEEIQREVSVMTTLGAHPHLVELKRVHVDKKGWHLVMELCSGRELFDEVMRRERFLEDDAADTIRQLASALEYCHSKDIVHRDIKLENILLVKPPQGVVIAEAQPMRGGPREPEGNAGENRPPQGPRGKMLKKATIAGKLELKLADFGLAVQLETGQKVWEVAGSPFYMAPEVVRGQPYDFPADIWSMGVILYALLSGLLPFTGPTNEHIFRAVRRAYIDLDSPSWEGVSRAAKSLVRRMLDPDPSRRPTAAEVLADPWVRGKAAPPTGCVSWNRKAARAKGYSSMCEEHGVFKAAFEGSPKEKPASTASTKERSWKLFAPFHRTAPKTPPSENSTRVPHPPSHPKPPSSGFGRFSKPVPVPSKAPFSSPHLSPTSTLEPALSSDSEGSTPGSRNSSPMGPSMCASSGGMEPSDRTDLRGGGVDKSKKMAWRAGFGRRFRPGGQAAAE